MKKNIKAELSQNFAPGLVVFLVALPLCLGIALASGAPPLSGIISGIIGGLVVGFLSNSNVSVSGPAAGLSAIVLVAVTDLGAFDIFLCAGIIAGVMQLILGFLKAGGIANYFPNSVIEGMLAGIGVIIIIQQIPVALGISGYNDFFSNGFQAVHIGTLLVTSVSIGILLIWEKAPFLRKLKMLPGALVAVTVGILLNQFFISSGSSLAISSDHLVKLPVLSGLGDVSSLIMLPNLEGFVNPKVWTIGITIAVVASIETLLCIEASDRLDIYKRNTNTNTELKAQGIGNVLSAAIGGLPMTSVVVRSSANINAGAKSKTSAIIHGVLLLICVLSIPVILNMIPLATLAAVLLIVGYKLAKPATFEHFWHKGKYQFLSFALTLGAVVYFDLLTGVALGMAFSILILLFGNIKKGLEISTEKGFGKYYNITLAEEVSFLNKASIKNKLLSLPEHSTVWINAKKTVYIHADILELIEDFANNRAKEKNITIKLSGFKDSVQINKDVDNDTITIAHRRAI
ncbi:MAG TPA: SulP family inorganic anion transporter [Flavobacterium sp.]|nr:SulP family inorganic anion transporter [Flavobacterium sp.]